MGRDRIGYVRVSTAEQNPQNQIMQLEEAGVPRDLIFVDRGVSGTIAPRKRPAFRKMVDYIADHPGEVRCIIVVELSRLGRTTMETITAVQELEQLGPIIWSLSPHEAFTRSEDAAIRQLLLMILSWVAERERANLIERTHAGLERARAEGKHLGRPRGAIDWEHVAALRQEGASWAAVAGHLGMSGQQLWRRRKAAGRL
jgi:putative DNA-invertase from lambdoid prophage Rac